MLEEEAQRILDTYAGVPYCRVVRESMINEVAHLVAGQMVRNGNATGFDFAVFFDSLRFPDGYGDET